MQVCFELLKGCGRRVRDGGLNALRLERRLNLFFKNVGKILFRGQSLALLCEIRSDIRAGPCRNKLDQRGGDQLRRQRLIQKSSQRLQNFRIHILLRSSEATALYRAA